MQTLTHDMENVFSKVRDGALKVNSSIIDTIFQCLDALEEYLDNIQSSADEGTNDNENIIKALNGFLNGESAEPKAEEKKTEPQAPSRYRTLSFRGTYANHRQPAAASLLPLSR